jgi:putative Holliday junction resolvase
MSDSFPVRGRIAGIDYGEVRVGIAVTDRDQKVASPYENYTRRGAEADARRFQRLVEQEQVVGFVVGLPVRGSGEESRKSREARQFGRWLGQATALPVRFFDERYTTVEAEQILAATRLSGKQRRRRLDMVAAQIMLTAYLESDEPRRQSPEALDD